jgi:hypothetical protein
MITVHHRRKRVGAGKHRDGESDAAVRRPARAKPSRYAHFLIRISFLAKYQQAERFWRGITELSLLVREPMVGRHLSKPIQPMSLGNSAVSCVAISAPIKVCSRTLGLMFHG